MNVSVIRRIERLEVQLKPSDPKLPPVDFDLLVDSEQAYFSKIMKLLRESLPFCGKPNVEMIAVMARYNPFAEHAGMTRVCESKPDNSVVDVVAELEKYGFTSYLLSVPEYNKRKLKGKVDQVKEILGCFSYPYNRRFAGAHGHFTKGEYRDWLQNVNESELARALARLAQLNQSKIYLFWSSKNS